MKLSLFTENLISLTSIAMTLLIPLAIVALKLRNLKAKEKLELEADGSTEDAGIVDAEALKRAEDDASRTPLDYREKLLEEHELMERFPTMRGYSSAYMDDLVSALHAAGFKAQYYFQETLPLGTGSVIQAQGVFELYIGRESEKEAKAFIQKWKNDRL